MTCRFEPPSGDLWGGPYIDDLGLVGFLPRKGGCSDGQAQGRVSEAAVAHRKLRQALQDEGLPTSQRKAVLGASEGVIWGGELSSHRGTVSAELSKRAKLVSITARILQLGRCSAGVLEKATGK